MNATLNDNLSNILTPRPGRAPEGQGAGRLKISVITIVRNGREFIEQTISSVVGQSYADFEYIVIDGGSTDGTIDVIRSYESRITKWISEKDEGIADAFNKGLRHATGDYILFLNADDALAGPDVLSSVAQAITENSCPMLLYGDCDVLDRASGEILYRASIQISREGLKRGQIIPQPSLFTSRKYFEKYGEFDKQFRIAMDYEWLLRGGMTEEIVHLPRLVTRVRNGGISTQHHARVVDEIIRALKKNNLVSSRWAEFKMRGYFFVRATARGALRAIGLYSLFSMLRNKAARSATKAD